MRNPKWQCAYPEGKRIVFGDKFLTQWNGYHLTLQQSTGGTISANKYVGFDNESATLSYTASPDYYFSAWQSTGANIQNNKVPFTQDTTAKANFVYTNPLNVSHSTFSKAATTDGLMLRNSYYEIDMQTTGVKSISGFTGMPVIAVNVDIKNNITSLNNMHVIPLFRTEVSAWEMYWDTSTNRWGLDVDTHHQFNAPSIDYHWTYPYWPAMSANRYPMIVPRLAKNIYVNPTYGASSTYNWIFAKCDNWLNKHNKLQYLIHYKSGSETDKNFDRTCFVSAYHDNNFVCSSWQNLYNVLISDFSAFGGLYSANLAGSGAYHRAVGGSIKLDIARFNTEAAGKKWLEIQ